MIELSKYVFEMLKLQDCQLLGRNLLQACPIEAQVRLNDFRRGASEP
jgi:hypothetical protein